MSATDDPRGPGPAVPPADALDELASALHDGEATPAQSARAAEPDVAARMAAFARVSEAVGAPVPPVDDATRDRAIAAALAAWGTPAAEDEPARDELARRRRSAAMLRPLGIAAAIVAAIAVGGIALGSTDGDGDDDMASDAATESDASEDAGAAPDDEFTVALDALVDLGSFTSLDALASAVDATVASRTASDSDATEDSGEGGGTGGDDGSATGTAGEGLGESVPGPPTGSVLGAPGCDPPEGAVGEPARATLEDRAVIAYVVDDGSGRRVVVLDEADCSVVGERPSSG